MCAKTQSARGGGATGFGISGSGPFLGKARGGPGTRRPSDDAWRRGQRPELDQAGNCIWPNAFMTIRGHSRRQAAPAGLRGRCGGLPQPGWLFRLPEHSPAGGALLRFNATGGPPERLQTLGLRRPGGILVSPEGREARCGRAGAGDYLRRGPALVRVLWVREPARSSTSRPLIPLVVPMQSAAPQPGRPELHVEPTAGAPLQSSWGTCRRYTLRYCRRHGSTCAAVAGGGGAAWGRRGHYVLHSQRQKPRVAGQADRPTHFARGGRKIVGGIVVESELDVKKRHELPGGSSAG